MKPTICTYTVENHFNNAFSRIFSTKFSKIKSGIRLFAFLPFLIFGISSNALAQIETEASDDEIFVVVEQQPEFPGGQEALMTYLKDNLKYPEEAKKNKVEGNVFVTFVVEKDGTISNVAILRGIGGGCDEEALRVISAMPAWKPGEQRGKPIRVQYNIPIRFAL